MLLVGSSRRRRTRRQSTAAPGRKAHVQRDLDQLDASDQFAERDLDQHRGGSTAARGNRGYSAEDVDAQLALIESAEARVAVLGDLCDSV